MTYFDEIAESIMTAPDFSKKVTGVGSVRILSVDSLRELLVKAAKMGAEASLALVGEHEVTMELVCGTCREAIVAEDIDENHAKWVHAHAGH